MPRTLAAGLALLGFLASGCLAPPPPIVVETPFGDVRARSEGKAIEVAALLERLAPEVRALLPGSQDRSVDVWVQEELQVYLFNRRPESVRGFTLLADEFDAKRIHLQEDGQSPWYLSHELVHALIGPSWSPLPGILEEGLGDVIAEALNPEYRNHIRAHRLLNASAFTGGLRIEVLYRDPQPDVPRRQWPRVRSTQYVQIAELVTGSTLRDLLSTPRTSLHAHWPDIPESFYGVSWLIVSRIVERSGLAGLHALCARARDQGYELVPPEWIEEAAEMDLDALDPEFLSSCFERQTLQTALYLQPDPFAEAVLDALRPLRGRPFRISDSRPVIQLWDGSELPLGYYIGPLYNTLVRDWKSRE